MRLSFASLVVVSLCLARGGKSRDEYRTELGTRLPPRCEVGTGVGENRPDLSFTCSTTDGANELETFLTGSDVCAELGELGFNQARIVNHEGTEAMIDIGPGYCRNRFSQ